MEFYLIQTFTTAARPHFAEALRLVQDTASAKEDTRLTVLSSAEAFARAARSGSLRDAVLLFAAQTDTAGMERIPSRCFVSCICMKRNSCSRAPARAY